MDLNVRDFPDDLAMKAKVAAVKASQSLKQWIIEAVKSRLKEGKP